MTSYLFGLPHHQVLAKGIQWPSGVLLAVNSL